VIMLCVHVVCFVKRSHKKCIAHTTLLHAQQCNNIQYNGGRRPCHLGPDTQPANQMKYHDRCTRPYCQCRTGQSMSVLEQHRETQDEARKDSSARIEAVCPHITTREPLNRFSLNFISVSFITICRYIPNSTKSDKNNGQITRRPTFVSVRTLDVTR
jgi:hypothetical protein